MASAARAQSLSPELIADKPVAEKFFKHEQHSERSGSNMLFCGRLAAAFVVTGGSVGSCVDMFGATYLMATASVGLAFGVHASGFVLGYRSFDGSPVEGTYYGGKVTAAVGSKGGAVGVFLKQPDNADNRGYLKRNQLFWIGYAAGATLDITALYVQIYKVNLSLDDLKQKAQEILPKLPHLN